MELNCTRILAWDFPKHRPNRFYSAIELDYFCFCFCFRFRVGVSSQFLCLISEFRTRNQFWLFTSNKTQIWIKNSIPYPKHQKKHKAMKKKIKWFVIDVYSVMFSEETVFLFYLMLNPLPMWDVIFINVCCYLFFFLFSFIPLFGVSRITFKSILITYHAVLT